MSDLHIGFSDLASAAIFLNNNNSVLQTNNLRTNDDDNLKNLFKTSKPQLNQNNRSLKPYTVIVLLSKRIRLNRTMESYNDTEFDKIRFPFPSSSECCTCLPPLHVTVVWQVKMTWKVYF
jgi:hypothetical protein